MADEAQRSMECRSLVIDQLRNGNGQSARQLREVHALCKAQAHQQGFGRLLANRQDALLGNSVPPFTDGGDPVFRLLMPYRSPPASATVGAGPYPRVILVPPI